MGFAGIVQEDSAFSVMGRLEIAGTNATQAAISAISYQIYPAGSTTAHTTATSLTVANVVFDSLQTDDRWTKDHTGYNFRHDLANTVLIDPSTDYEIEYYVTPTTGDPFYTERIDVEVTAVKSS